MHTLLLLISFVAVYAALKQEYRKIEQTKAWTNRSGLACYILCSAALLLLGITLNFWLMYIGGCIAFQALNWDTEISLTLGALLWIFLGVSLMKRLWSQWKLQQIMALVTPCKNPAIIQLLRSLSQKMGLLTPDIALYRSNQPYAATLFWRKPVLLLSSWMIEVLDEEQLEAVIAHELAHIKRQDNLMISIGGILKEVLFFLPTIQKTWQKFLMDLETAADDVAVLVTGRPTALASAIVRVHQEQPQMEFSYGISYFTPDYQQIEKRVERLLSNDVERLAKAATVRFSKILFSRDIFISASLLTVILTVLIFIPYCHWLV